MEDFGVVHVRCRRYEKGYFETCPKHYFRHYKNSNPNPAPTHTMSTRSRKNQAFICMANLSTATLKVRYKYSPTSMRCSR